jgi:hypothetical protein
VPVQPDPSQNFIHALSDFWSVFFKDTTQIQSYFKGVEINVGQLYLDLLETVLGTNLANAPVFSKKYYKLIAIREDEVFFSEGSSADTDRYTYAPADYALGGVSALMNRVIDPTEVLMSGREFEVADGSLRFRSAIFNSDGNGGSIPRFPVRTLNKSFPATYTDLLKRRFWEARPGDSLRFRIVGGSEHTVKIVGVRQEVLLLESTKAEFTSDLSRRTFSVTVLRKPFDSIKNGLLIEPHPSIVERLSSNTDDASLLPGTKSIDLSAEPYYRGAWAALTPYAAGDLVVAPSTELVRALIAHTSGAAYTAENWDTITGKYCYVGCPSEPQNDGLYAVLSTTATTIIINRLSNFLLTTSMRATVTLVGYPTGLVGPLRPTINLDHSHLDQGSLVISARRAHPVPGGPANQAVVEGLDYAVNYETGTITVLSGWDPRFPARAEYTWMLPVTTITHTYRGAYSSSETYTVGDVVQSPDLKAYVSRTGATPFSPNNWDLFASPFAFDQLYPVRQIAFWGTDVLLDLETLYQNFGYLLAFKHPSSEQYRAFLQGVSQLFVIGPTMERFESALNVMTNLPVIRDDGEILRAYSDGILYSAADGSVTDSDEGRDGSTTTAGNIFTAPSATFFSSDVGATLRVQFGTSLRSFLVTAVTSTTRVVVSPPPPDATGLVWSFTHVSFNRLFSTTSYTFTPEDQDSEIIIEGASNAKNNGRFRIETVENLATVTLSAPFGLTDETALRWKLSRTGAQTVTTSRTTYTLPLWVPVRADIVLPASIDTLVFQAFETITDAFHVTDYVQDPTWWHRISIPENVARFTTELRARRRASPNMIEHRLSPLDDALVGDFGLTINADDEGRPGLNRSGPATWYGGDSLVLTLAPGTPGPVSTDVGKYVTVEAPDFRVQFRLQAIEASGTVLRLEAFPPPHVVGAPRPFTVTLSPLLYRRTVGFVMMDRFLKYHALRIQVNLAEPFEPTFIGEATQLFREAKPGYTYVYLESPLDFLDTMVISDRDLVMSLRLSLEDRMLHPDNSVVVGPPGLLQLDDGFRYTAFSQDIPAAVGTYPLTPTLPAGVGVRFHVVKGRFNLSALVGTTALTEGVHYNLDRLNGVVHVLTPLPAATVSFNYVAVILRPRTPMNLDQAVGETGIVVNGTDPTTWWALGQTVADAGLIDRAVQLTIGP